MNRLEQGYREQDAFTVGGILSDPLLVSLHGDPHVHALAQKIVPLRSFKTITTAK